MTNKTWLAAAGLLLLLWPAAAAEEGGQGNSLFVPVTIQLRNGRSISGLLNRQAPVHLCREREYVPLALAHEDTMLPLLYDQAQAKLLAVFPADEGWSAERRVELQTRRQQGEQLHDQEDFFLAHFAGWSEADHLRQLQLLLDRFPPSAWSLRDQERLAAQAAEGQTLTEEERCFLDAFELWREAVQRYRDLQRQAGFQVWYPNNVDGFLFVSYSQVGAPVRPGSALDDRELAALEQQRAELSRRSEAAGQAALTELDAWLDQRRQDRHRPSPTPAGEERIVLADRALQALLDAFPPDQGWSPTRLAEIEARINRKLELTNEEWRFYDQFPQWEPAYQAWQRAKVELEERKRQAALAATPTAPPSAPPSAALPPATY